MGDGVLDWCMSVHRTAAGQNRPQTDSDLELSTADVLSLFGDEYTRRVFEAVAERPRGGRSVAEAADVSRPTAYRRLNELQDAGLVTSDLVLCESGNHHEQYEAVVDTLSVSLTQCGVEATVKTTD